MGMREFHFKQSGMDGTNSNMILSFVMIGFGAISLTVTGGGGLPIGIGVMFLLTTSWKKGRSLITLHEDHLEMKAAPLAARQLILYRDISMLDDSAGPKKVYLLTGGKRVRLPTHALEVPDQHELIAELNKRTGLGPKGKQR